MKDKQKMVVSFLYEDPEKIKCLQNQQTEIMFQTI